MKTNRSIGVYEIYCVPTQKIYIGSTTNSFHERWRDHRLALGKGTHTNRYLQNAWNKYGETAFRFLVLENMGSDSGGIREAEQWYLDNVKTHKQDNGGYNISLDATAPMSGRKMPPESVEARASKLRGKKRDPAHIRRGKDHHWFGKKHSLEHRKKLSQNHADVSGENAGNSKLTNRQVLSIRKSYKNGGVSYSDLAKAHNVDKSTIFSIIKRQTWTKI